MIDFDSKPDFINEEGTKWWLDKDLTSYAKSKDLDLVCWITETKDGAKTRVLVDKDVPIHDTTTLDGMACHIDAIWMSEQ